MGTRKNGNKQHVQRSGDEHTRRGNDSECNNVTYSSPQHAAWGVLCAQDALGTWRMCKHSTHGPLWMWFRFMVWSMWRDS